MLTNFKTATTNGDSRRRRVFRPGTWASAAVLVVGLIASGNARSEQMRPLHFMTLVLLCYKGF
jgi:hypothetical protein